MPAKSLVTAGLLAGAVTWGIALVSCEGGNGEAGIAPLDVPFIPMGGEGECDRSTYCIDFGSNHPGYPPGTWGSNGHFYDISLNSPDYCTDVDFNETVFFEFEYSTGHETVRWKSQYLDEDGVLVGTANTEAETTCPGEQTVCTDTFSITLDGNSDHSYLLVWTLPDPPNPGEDVCDLSVKLAREGVCPDGRCDGGETVTSCPQDCAGDIEVTTSTDGEEQDDEYTVILDGDPQGTIAGTATKTLEDLAPGTYSVELGDIASNCSVTTENPQSVTVNKREIAEANFEINCVAMIDAVVDGPLTPGPNLTCTWEGNFTGGMAPFTYEWKKGKLVVGTSQNYTGNTGSSDFTLKFTVTDSYGLKGIDTHLVTIGSGTTCGKSGSD